MAHSALREPTAEKEKGSNCRRQSRWRRRQAQRPQHPGRRRACAVRIAERRHWSGWRKCLGDCGGSNRFGFAIRHEEGHRQPLREPQTKDSQPVRGGVWSPGRPKGALDAAGSRCDPDAGWRFDGKPLNGGRQEPRPRRERSAGSGTLLLSPVVRASQVQRFSSTAVYPTIRGSRIPCFPTLAARGLWDTLLPH